ITLTNDDNTNIIDHEHFIRYFLTPSIDDDNDLIERQQFNYMDYFKINHTNGEIYVLKPLDYDYPNGRPTYTFNAYSENIQTKQILAHAKIIIHLNNINDNQPFFTENIYYANITENNLPNISIIQVNAIDYDNYYDDGDEQLKYSIIENHLDENGRKIFQINSDNGWIWANVCCLDREQTSNYTIIVSAIDTDGFMVSIFSVFDIPPHHFIVVIKIDVVVFRKNFFRKFIIISHQYRM
ncbi:hypothetical protein BLA29_008547, partial [Euroglyphus maynei]